MPAKSIDQLYFNWVVHKVMAVTDPNPRRTYWLLFERMFNKPFEWYVLNDDNRVMDGLELRDLFADDGNSWGESTFPVQAPCSMLEMMIGMSRRLAFFSGNGELVDKWFHQLLRNTGLSHYTDEVLAQDLGLVDEVEFIFDRIIYRKYDYTGEGGLFPLESPHQDQRLVELWYQAQSYLLENDTWTD